MPGKTLAIRAARFRIDKLRRSTVDAYGFETRSEWMTPVALVSETWSGPRERLVSITLSYGSVLDLHGPLAHITTVWPSSSPQPYQVDEDLALFKQRDQAVERHDWKMMSAPLTRTPPLADYSQATTTVTAESRQYDVTQSFLERYNGYRLDLADASVTVICRNADAVTVGSLVALADLEPYYAGCLSALEDWPAFQ